MYGISWNSAQGTVTLASDAGPAYAGFNVAPSPGQYESWSSAVTLSDASVPDPALVASVTPVNEEPLTEEIRHSIISSVLVGTPAGHTTITLQDNPSFFQIGESVRIVDRDTPSYEQASITAIDEGAQQIVVDAMLIGTYTADEDIVLAASEGTHHRFAARAYRITPRTIVGADTFYDKKIVPDSVRVRVNAWKDTDLDSIIDPGELANKEYRRVGSNQDNIGPGQFVIEPAAPGDYRAITIHFGNGKDGGNGVRTPPPSPDWAASYGAPESWDDDPTALTAFWIEISYNVRRNFSTATLRNDQIDVSYSTRAVYNVSLELLPWRYYEDNDNDHIWTPYQRTKGVDLQAHIRIAALGG